MPVSDASGDPVPVRAPGATPAPPAEPAGTPAGTPANDRAALKAALKQAVRTELRHARRGLDAATWRVRAAQLCEALCRALPQLLRGAASPATVTAYAPLGTEPGGPDLPEALRRALPPPARLLLPVLLADLDLDWAAYRGDLVGAGRGLREPPGPRLGPDAIATADLVVVPALAVDHRGVRLGRGGGSYDRALARVRPEVPVVALLYDGELRAEHLPTEPHDRRVNAVVTPGAGLRLLPVTSGRGSGPGCTG